MAARGGGEQRLSLHPRDATVVHIRVLERGTLCGRVHMSDRDELFHIELHDGRVGLRVGPRTLSKQAARRREARRRARHQDGSREAMKAAILSVHLLQTVCKRPRSSRTPARGHLNLNSSPGVL